MSVLTRIKETTTKTFNSSLGGFLDGMAPALELGTTPARIMGLHRHAVFR